MFFARFGIDSLSDRLLSHGWSVPEREWVWSDGRISLLTIAGYASRRCRLSLRFDAAAFIGPQIAMRVAVNGVDYGVKTFPAGPNTLTLEHEETPGAPADGLFITLYHLTCRTPAEVEGEDRRLINIALRSLTVETLAPRLVAEVPGASPGEKGDAWFRRLEVEAYYRETNLKNRVLEAAPVQGPRRALEFFLYGLGGNRHDREWVWRALLDDQRSHGVPSPEFAAPETLAALTSRIAPDFAPCLMTRRNDEGVARRPVFPRRENPLFEPVRWPQGVTGVGWVMSEQWLPDESIYSAPTAELIASPRQYMIFDRQANAYYADCNPAGLSLLSTDGDLVVADGPVVIARDQFDASNVSHFLFDACLRVALFCETFPDLKSKALFVLGGTPTPFHHLAVEALRGLYGLSEGQIVFPRSHVCVRSPAGVYWFSDQVRDRHPCQRFRPEALEIFTRLAREMRARVAPSPQRAARLLVSRRDASLRRLANEDALMERLKPLGFQRLVMSEHSWADQIDLIGNAEVIVGAHGMGLTMAAFNFARPTMVEIFNPTIGSGAYALMAKAYGMNYHAVMGHETDPRTRDYAVSDADIETITRLAGG